MGPSTRGDGGRSKGKRKRLGPVGIGFVLLVGLPAAAIVLLPRILGSSYLVLDSVAGQQPLRLLASGGLVLAFLVTLGRRPRLVMLGLGLLAAFGVVDSLLSLPPVFGRSRPAEAAKPLRVLTQNVNQEPPEAWLSALEANQVDVGCFQEVYVTNLSSWEQGLKDLGYQSAFQLLRADAGMGTLIASRAELTPLPPIVETSRDGLQRSLVRAEVEWSGGKITVVSVHFESAPRDLGLFQFLNSWPLRAEQAQAVVHAVQELPGLVVVAGDLNATPTDRTIRGLRRSLDDSWMTGGRWLGGTYPRTHPLLRIDSVLSRGFAGASAAEVLDVGWSDHAGYLVTLWKP